MKISEKCSIEFAHYEEIDLSKLRIVEETYDEIDKTNVAKLLKYFKRRGCSFIFDINDEADIVIGVQCD